MIFISDPEIEYVIVSPSGSVAVTFPGPVPVLSKMAVEFSFATNEADEVNTGEFGFSSISLTYITMSCETLFSPSDAVIVVSCEVCFS